MLINLLYLQVSKKVFYGLSYVCQMSLINIIIYFISISVGLFLITYLLEIPHRVTGNREIVNK